MVAPFKYDLWYSDSPVKDDDVITVNCFMPNGNCIPFCCSKSLTLFDMKEVCEIPCCVCITWVHDVCVTRWKYR
jgi:hypothetical protein